MSTGTEHLVETRQPVLFFDGECVMCNGVVDLLLKIDRSRVFRFASLQGETAKRLRGRSDEFPEDLESFVFWDRGQVELRSSAIFAAAKRLGLPWNLLSVFSILPRRLTDAVYRWIARNRIKWFGRKESCRMPSPEEAPLFLE